MPSNYSVCIGWDNIPEDRPVGDTFNDYRWFYIQRLLNIDGNPILLTIARFKCRDDAVACCKILNDNICD